MSFLALFLVALIDVVLFGVTFLSFDLLYFTIYLVIHFILFFIFRYIYFRYVHDSRYELIPLFIGLAIPGVGYIVLATNLFSLKVLQYNGNLLESYDQHVHYDDYVKIIDRKEFFDDSSVLSYNDKFNVLDEKQKKYFLIETLEKNYSKRDAILKMGLDSNEMEVQYYSAVSNNFIHENYENLLKEKVSKYEASKDLMDLQSLITVYLDYLENSLMADEIKQIHYNRLLPYAKSLLETGVKSAQNVNKVVRVFMSLDMLDDSLELINESLREFPNEASLYLLKGKILYLQKDYTSIQSLFQTLVNNELELDIDEQSIVDYWLKGGHSS